jgi:hypothetical protein
MTPVIQTAAVVGLTLAAGGKLAVAGTMIRLVYTESESNHYTLACRTNIAAAIALEAVALALCASWKGCALSLLGCASMTLVVPAVLAITYACDRLVFGRPY